MKWIYGIALFATTNVCAQYEIGETVLTFTDTERDREIETFIYYPATATGEEVDLSEGKFPVIAVGHGFAMTYASYAYLWEALVPLGYILALPNTESGLDASHGDFGMDLGFVIQAMKEEDLEEASLFYEHISPHSCVMGHSMGGGAAVLAASEDPSITTLVTLAPAETDPSAIAAANLIDQPSLTFAGAEDCVTPPADHQEPIYDNHNDCKGYVLIDGATHCQFANSNFVCELGEFSCPDDGLIEESDQHEIIIEVLSIWLKAYLKTDFSAWEMLEALEGDNDDYSLELACADHGPALSTNEIVENNDLLYPNPVTEYLYVPSAFQDQPYSIYGSDGNLIQSGNIGSKLNLYFLDSGSYLIKLVQNDGSQIVKRFQKAK